jgi:hypothetical protein
VNHDEVSVKNLIHMLVLLVLAFCCSTVIAGIELVPFKLAPDKATADLKQAEVNVAQAKMEFAIAERAYRRAKIVSEIKKLVIGNGDPDLDLKVAVQAHVIARLDLLIAEVELADAKAATHRKKR